MGNPRKYHYESVGECWGRLLPAADDQKRRHRLLEVKTSEGIGSVTITIKSSLKIWLERAHPEILEGCEQLVRWRFNLRSVRIPPTNSESSAAHKTALLLFVFAVEFGEPPASLPSYISLTGILKPKLGKEDFGVFVPLNPDSPRRLANSAFAAGTIPVKIAKDKAFPLAEGLQSAIFVKAAFRLDNTDIFVEALETELLGLPKPFVKFRPQPKKTKEPKN